MLSESDQAHSREAESSGPGSRPSPDLKHILSSDHHGYTLTPDHRHELSPDPGPTLTPDPGPTLSPDPPGQEHSRRWYSDLLAWVFCDPLVL